MSKSIRVRVSLTPDQYQKLNHVAEEKGVSLSTAFRYCLDTYWGQRKCSINPLKTAPPKPLVIKGSIFPKQAFSIQAFIEHH